MMPIDLVLVRHGESEGGEANRRSRNDDHSAFTDEFINRHSMYWRLTDRGIAQARAAGQWIRMDKLLGAERGDNWSIFDRYYTSAYIRALETAYHLNLPGATWRPEFYLRERDYGVFDVMSQENRVSRYHEVLEERERQSLFWTPPNGESVATLCLRVDRMLDTLHRECADGRVIAVCHGKTMWAFRIRLERISLARYEELHRSQALHDHIHTSQILHYTRRDPVTGNLDKRYEWMRSACPWDSTRSTNVWNQINRPTFTNDDLKTEFEHYQRLVNNS